MKKLLVLLAALVAGFTLQAQTNLPPANTQEFYQTVLNFFTTFNTNLDWSLTTNHADISMGMATVDNAKIAAEFAVDANVWKSLSLRGNVRNDTILGHVFSAQGGAGWNWLVHDVKVEAFGEVGHRFDFSQTYLAPGLDFKKKLSDNTYLNAGIELPFAINHGSNPNGSSLNSPTFWLMTGFRF